METQKKKVNYWIIIGTLAILSIGAYYSYLDIEKARNNGVYTIAQVTKLRPARNGWKVKTELNYNNKLFEFEHLEFWEVFSFNDRSKRFFAKINVANNECKLGFIYSKAEVPDSIQSAPPEGWNEAWMKEHFPEVVEYVHDAR